MKTVKVWDPFVRLFHWSLVAGVITQLATAEDWKSVHAKIGYGIAVILPLRIIWGIVGPQHARFADFVYPPADIFGYLKDLIKGRPRHYIGHNPAGGAMVCTLLFFLILTALAGLKTLGAEGNGPLALWQENAVTRVWADEDSPGEGENSSRHDVTDQVGRHSHFHPGNKARVHFWKEIHETLVGISLFLIGLHICGVVASSFVHRENLILAMITGKKKAP